MDRKWRVRLKVGQHAQAIRKQWIEERIVYGVTARDDAIALAAGESDHYVHGCDGCEEVV